MKVVAKIANAMNYLMKTHLMIVLLIMNKILNQKILIIMKIPIKVKMIIQKHRVT